MDTTERIRRRVAKSGLTQYAVARAAGIDQAQINRFVTGRIKGLTVKSADKILGAMGYKLMIVRKAKRGGRGDGKHRQRSKR